MLARERRHSTVSTRVDSSKRGNLRTRTVLSVCVRAHVNCAWACAYKYHAYMGARMVCCRYRRLRIFSDAHGWWASAMPALVCFVRECAFGVRLCGHVCVCVCTCVCVCVCVCVCECVCVCVHVCVCVCVCVCV